MILKELHIGVQGAWEDINSEALERTPQFQASGGRGDWMISRDPLRLLFLSFSPAAS